MARNVEESVAKALKETMTKMNEGQFDNDVANTNEERRRLGLNALGTSKDKEADGNPACDACGSEGTGVLLCTQCRSVFYCSKACQKNDWKHLGHKQACLTLKEEVERVGKQVADRMGDDDLPAIARVQGMDLLDGSGPYRVAVTAGLHGAVKDLFQNDLETCLERFLDGSDTTFCTQFIMSGIFKGQRREGQGTTGGSFRCIDGQRVKSYVASSPDAFDVWFDASLEVFRTALDNQLYRSNRSHQQLARNGARDVWAAWIFVFVNPSASKRILLPNGVADEAAGDRARSIAKRIKKLLQDRWDAPSAEGKDPNSTLEGILNQVTAQVSYWCREFEIPVEFEQLLELDGAHLQMYSQMAKPVGEATIAKGISLTNEEFQAAVAAHQEQRQPKVNPNRRKSGKKGKKGRR